jgi:apolipoprotein N-acyltransferase
MAVVFTTYSFIRSTIKRPGSQWLLIPIWIAWEHLHTLWDISWTWLTLGNVFAFNHRWIQWYEVTGTSGGTLWALAVNILVLNAIVEKKVRSVLSRPVFFLFLSVLIPVIASFSIYYLRSTPSGKTASKYEVVVVQPNIDPYNEKFYLDYSSQFDKALRLVRDKISARTEYLVLPETFITGINSDINEETMNHFLEVQWFRDSLISKHPQLKIISGANTFKFYEDKGTVTSRKDMQSGKQYDVFNAALFIEAHRCEVYHKSKLVPGVEKMPFPALLKPLESMAIDMGGTVGSLGTQDDRSVFVSDNKKTIIAPVICYESIYADYVADYIRLGANLIFIITNDGWWDDTPGYKQHLNFARLRAIENRREIARSANTGISCFIDRLGNISQPTAWWKEAVIKQEMSPKNELTFFSRFGDLISYSSVAVTLALILVAVWLQIRYRRTLRA